MSEFGESRVGGIDAAMWRHLEARIRASLGRHRFTPQEVEDIVGIVRVQLLRALARESESEKVRDMKSWVVTAADRRAKDLIKRKKTERKRLLPLSPVVVAVTPAPPSPTRAAPTPYQLARLRFVVMQLFRRKGAGKDACAVRFRQRLLRQSWLTIAKDEVIAESGMDPPDPDAVKRRHDAIRTQWKRCSQWVVECIQADPELLRQLAVEDGA